MSSRKSKKQSRRSKGTTNPHGVVGNFAQRHEAMLGIIGGLVGIVGLVVAVVALIPTIRSADLAEEANHNAQTAQVSIVRVDMTSTVELTEKTEFAGSDEEAQTAHVNTSAAKIILHNSGEQAALVKELRVEVSRVWALEGCHGAGGAMTSTRYDFVLPGDITSQRMPIKLSRKIDFEIAGQSNDRLAVTIGEDYFGEAGWPWVISASAKLVLNDGSTLRTGEFLLMNVSRVDRVVELVEEGVRQGYDRAECVQRNIGMLEEAIRTPGDHSPSVQLLVDRLAELGFTATSSPSSPAGSAPPTSPPSYTNTWVAQLGSYPEATTSGDQLQQAVDGIAAKLGVEVQTTRSSDYSSLTPGYWVVFYPGEFADGYEALSFCSSHDITDDNACVGRYFSESESDRQLTCRFSEPDDSPVCRRQ